MYRQALSCHSLGSFCSSTKQTWPSSRARALLCGAWVSPSPQPCVPGGHSGKQVASKAASVGLLKQEDAQLDTYVTARALDGLYLVIGEKEREFRSNPLAAGSAVIEKALGALKP